MPHQGNSNENIPLLSRRMKKKQPKLEPFASWPGAMINPQWLKLSMFRRNFHGPWDVGPIGLTVYACPYNWLCWGLMICQPLWVILCHLPENVGKRGRRDSKGDEREGQGRKREMKESEGTEEITTFLLYPYLLQWQPALPNYKPLSAGRPVDNFISPNHPLSLPFESLEQV